MSTPPRRRRSSADDRTGGGRGWLPTVAMALGVIVAGLGIGALIAVLMQRTTEKAEPGATPVVLATTAPQAAPLFTRPPIAIATIAPPRTPRPSPSASATATAEPSPSPSPSPSPTQSPAAEPTATATEPPAQTAPPIPTVKPAAAAVRVAAAAAAPTEAADKPEATATPLATTAPATPGAPAGSAYDAHAEAVVRRYVEALARGDEKSAYAALGGSGTLSEESFLDPSAQIVSMKVTRIDAANASVGCEIVSAKGRYYGTYHVTAATSGPYISEHDYIKV